MKSAFRSFNELNKPAVQTKEEPAADTASEDYSQHIEKLRESIEDRKELVIRLGKMVEELDREYDAPAPKKYEDMQRIAELENRMRLVEKRVLRLTDHIKTYIDYFYTDPCPSDDPLTWGN